MPRVLAPALLIALLPAAVFGQFNFNYATPYAITTLAGTTSAGHADGTDARFYQPCDIAVDASGNLYIAEKGNHTIRKRTPDGRVSTLAGSPGESGAADGTGMTARFQQPAGVAVDAAGNVYVADSYNQTVRKISATGAVTTLAGTPGSRGSTDGAGAAARFDRPTAVAVDAAGNVYVADTFNCTIRKITPAGMVTTLAGSPGQTGTTEGNGSAARFRYPQGVAVDAAGNVYVADSGGQSVRKITPAGQTSTFAGLSDASGHVDGVGTAARLAFPTGLALDAAGNLYVSSSTRTVRKITPDGRVTTLAGTPDVAGSNDGPGASAFFGNLDGIGVDAAGNAFVPEQDTNTIRKIATDAMVSTIAGVSEITATGHGDATGSAARFSLLTDIAVDVTGNLYVPDPGNHCVRKISPTGVVTTFAGAPNRKGSSDGTGASASFGTPTGIGIDSSGTLYVADGELHVIRKITPAGVVSTLAGSAGESGLVDGAGAAARFYTPSGVDVDAAGNVYVMDRLNHAVRKITPAGVVTTLITRSSVIDGTLILFQSANLAVDPSGNIFICDTLTSSIRRLTPGGALSLFAGSGQTNGFNDGTGNGARFNEPTGIATDGNGNVYVVDRGNGLIRRISPAGVVTTLAGSVFLGSRADGAGQASGFDAPYGITADASGTIYVTDAGSIRKGRPVAAPVITTQPQNASVATGGSAQFSVSANGAPDPTYQWYFNGSTFVGATARMLDLTNARSSDAGDYTVVVTNSLGSVTSTKATLTVGASSPPPSSGGSSAGGGSGGGGGGAPSAWFVLALLLLFTARGIQRRGAGLTKHCNMQTSLN